MRTLLTGTAQSVTNTSERVRKIFQDRPLEAPVKRERQNRPHKTFIKAAKDDVAPEAEAPEGDKATSVEGDPEEE
jgi:hypothetical protein